MRTPTRQVIKSYSLQKKTTPIQVIQRLHTFAARDETFIKNLESESINRESFAEILRGELTSRK